MRAQTHKINFSDSQQSTTLKASPFLILPFTNMRNPFNSPSCKITCPTYLKRELESSNEEWPEIINANTAMIGKPQKIKTLPPSRKPKREVDLQQVTADDLQTIKKQDPFMYYSVPGVLNAEMQMKEVDVSNIRNCLSCPARMQTMKTTTSSTPPSSTTVTRSTCISYECHPDVFLEDFLNDEGSGDVDMDFVDDSDELDRLMELLGV